MAAAEPAPVRGSTNRPITTTLALRHLSPLALEKKDQQIRAHKCDSLILLGSRPVVTLKKKKLNRFQ